MMLGRILLFVGGLFGAAGVALSAVNAHIGGTNIGTAATYLLAHAPALVAIGLLDARRGDGVVRFGGLLLLVGPLLFSGDLLIREFTGERLFPMAAPSGGTLTILGWVIVAIGAIWRRGGESRADDSSSHRLPGKGAGDA
ncbi:MAG TPA: DUF423 domain-containing protein [Rhizobiales bacterium]|nr:DUF423 domain-containing protein [Hyphomicrobiales bacterium]